ncbi:MAG TPA: hypothetical protein VFA07_12145 [Chthonomonadaceae bacterium]|nr:hypothetical protein [Chthonomonadaceae bacterium]
MRSVEELIGKHMQRRPAAERSLLEFCDYLAEALHPARRERAPSVEDVVHAFRQFWRVPVPVGPYLEELCRKMGVAFLRHENIAGIDACSDFDGETQRWEIYVRSDVGLREGLCVLREVFKILSRQAYESVSWWSDWLAAGQTASANRLASRFAYAVVLPPKQFGEAALTHGLNPWTLATCFLTTPGACFFALTRTLRLPAPYFQAHLNFRPPTPEQTRLCFTNESVQAQVWRKSLSRVYGRPGEQWPEMEALAAGFPATGRILEADGMLLEAIRSCRSVMETTDHLAGIKLPHPVCVVARPNGMAQSQMFVQAVPHDYAGLLMEVSGSEI